MTNSDYKKLKPILDDKAFEPLDEEEREIMESVERGEWVPVSPEERKRLSAMLFEAARNSIAAREMVSVEFKKNRLRFNKRRS